ncbi:unnamed protein product, partial [Amoebophrya sp. A120]
VTDEEEEEVDPCASEKIQPRSCAPQPSCKIVNGTIVREQPRDQSRSPAHHDTTTGVTATPTHPIRSPTLRHNRDDHMANHHQSAKNRTNAAPGRATESAT